MTELLTKWHGSHSLLSLTRYRTKLLLPPNSRPIIQTVKSCSKEKVPMGTKNTGPNWSQYHIPSHPKVRARRLRWMNLSIRSAVVHCVCCKLYILDLIKLPISQLKLINLLYRTLHEVFNQCMLCKFLSCTMDSV